VKARWGRAIKSANRGHFLTKRDKTDEGGEAYIETVDQSDHPPAMRCMTR